MKLGNFQVLDSMLFFRYSLKKTNMLGMQDKEEKGFHPYKFTNISYVGAMIPEHFFDLDNMNKTERQKEKQIYYFEQEFFKYCSNDVDVLRNCLLKMNSIIKNTTGIEFLFDSQITTLSSLSLVIFLQNFTKEDSLPITLITGYPNLSKKNNKPQSLAAMLWLNKQRKIIQEEK